LRNRGFVAATFLIVTAAVPSRVGAPDDLARKIVNDPGEPQVNGAKASLHDDSKAQGGKALRIQVKGKGTNAWDAALESPVKKSIKAGDQVVLAFEARLEKGDNGATTAALRSKPRRFERVRGVPLKRRRNSSSVAIESRSTRSRRGPTPASG